MLLFKNYTPPEVKVKKDGMNPHKEQIKRNQPAKVSFL